MFVKCVLNNLLVRASFYNYRYISREKMIGMELKAVVQKLEEFAPLTNAETWDNVGLLIEPHTPKTIKTIFLTNDLTEPVLKEALEKNTDLIISYHPPIFAPLKRITQNSWKERIVSICLENRIALYSPHTAWDVANGGVNDWLASAFPYSEIVPIKQSLNMDGGIGRKVILTDQITLNDAIKMVKELINIPNVQVAIGNNSCINSNIKTIAICAGSGGSLLKNVDANLYLTGEMSHHEVLDATQKNISVILCNHSNSERGYLNEFKSRLENSLLGTSNILISETDADPLSTY